MSDSRRSGMVSNFDEDNLNASNQSTIIRHLHSVGKVYGYCRLRVTSIKRSSRAFSLVMKNGGFMSTLKIEMNGYVRTKQATPRVST